MSPGLRAQEKFVEKGTTAAEALAKAKSVPAEQLRTQAHQKLIQEGLDPAKAMQKVTKMTEEDLRRAAISEVTGGGLFGRFGEHMAAPSVGLREAWGSATGAGRLRAVAEELSRSGWTGGQSWSKYIPWGEKAWLPATGAMAIPSMVNAPAPTPTGEGGALEHGLGALGMGAGMVLGGGLGVVPALGAFYLGEKAGGRIGRILDRIRGGGTAGQALFAPSPTEATEQLQNIYRHYG